MKLVDIFSRPGRDPRGWVVFVAFMAVVDAKSLIVQAGDDAAEAMWYEMNIADNSLSLWINGTAIDGSELAFDHEEVLRKALILIS